MSADTLKCVKSGAEATTYGIPDSSDTAREVRRTVERIPARRAASIPAGASSNTRQFSGATPSRDQKGLSDSRH